MVRLTANKTPMCVLDSVLEPAEVYDENGDLIGVYVPANMKARRQMYDDLKLTISEEEIQRRLNTKTKGVTTRELFEHLLSLATEEKDREQLRKIIEEVKERDRCDSR